MPGRDFASEKPICPHCGLDGTPGTRFANRILALRTLHFDPPHPSVTDAGTGVPACGAVRQNATAMTGDPNVVNCPACRKSLVWLTAKKKWDQTADDFEPPVVELAIDATNQQYKA